ncbi:hypothetical protein Pmani_014005 [Petrolisthes manimaculis]|uniref:Ig-like domain-containing protein n=1 Tax=Petrolisthes manimaculis TaxID=1843537 RepID=A0AAE1PUU3_9EUCA|nr:hypothetical protein Pmani_014005 [Petrolisthes manimaculis]
MEEKWSLYFVRHRASPSRPSEPFSSESPKVASGSEIDSFRWEVGSAFALPCKVQGYPIPEFSESPKVAEDARGNILIKRALSGFALTCRVQGFPVPSFRYATPLSTCWSK